MKPCRKCGNVGPYCPYNLRRSDWICKICAKKAGQKYYDENKEVILKKNKLYREKNKMKIVM